MGRYESDLDQRSQPIDLALVAAFTIGSLRIDPSTLQASIGEVHHNIQPRAMKVLVAFHDALGEVVSRDELIARCWDRQVVGDDAIQKIVAKVRQLGRDHPGTFDIETIPKVGYRMQMTDGSIASAAPAKHGLSRRHALGLAGLAAIGAIAGGMTIWGGPPVSRQRREAMTLFERGVEAEALGLPESVAQAGRYFKLATETDPEYADAWGALAKNFAIMVQVAGGRRPEQWLRRVDSAVERGLALDPDNIDARLARAITAPFLNNWAAYEDGLAAMRRETDDAILMLTQARLMMNSGRWNDAVDVLNALERLNPLTPTASLYLTYCYWGAMRFEEAESESRATIARYPNHFGSWLHRAEMMIYWGEASRALAFIDQKDERPSMTARRMEDIRPFAAAFASGDIGAKRAFVKNEVARRSADLDAVPQLFTLVAMIDDRDLAIDLMDGYFQDKGPYGAPNAPPLPARARAHSSMLFEPTSKPFHALPELRAHVRAIGLFDYWSARSIPSPIG